MAIATTSDIAPTMPAREEWRSVVGYEDWYEVSSFGRVRRFVDRYDEPIPVDRRRILRPRPKKNGYVQVNLSVYGKRLNQHIHSLVAAAFIGPRPNGLEVNHKDQDKTNNSKKNLEYVTKKYNLREAGRHGRMARDTAGEKHPKSKLTESDVHQIRKLFATGSKRRDLANRFGVTWEAIHMVVTRKAWRHI